MGAISHKRKDKCSLIASSARRSRLDSWAAVGCGWHATVRNFRQIGVHPPLTTPATVIPCKKCKRRPGYPIDARRRWRGWRRTARILGGSSSGPALSRPPIRPRPAQPEARAVFVGDYAFSDDRAGLLLLKNISQSLIFRTARNPFDCAKWRSFRSSRSADGDRHSREIGVYHA